MKPWPRGLTVPTLPSMAKRPAISLSLSVIYMSGLEYEHKGYAYVLRSYESAPGRRGGSQLGGPGIVTGASPETDAEVQVQVLGEHKGVTGSESGSQTAAGAVEEVQRQA